jgi:RNA polymerase subunit RPABC4/transcription elongation factor Spt4
MKSCPSCRALVHENASECPACDIRLRPRELRWLWAIGTLVLLLTAWLLAR